MDRATAQEPERREHGAGAVHRPLVQAAHAVGVVEEHAAGLVVQEDPDPVRCGQNPAHVPGAERGLRDEESTHAHRQQCEGLRHLETRVLAAAVVPAVVIIPVGETSQTETEILEKYSSETALVIQQTQN